MENYHPRIFRSGKLSPTLDPRYQPSSIADKTETYTNQIKLVSKGSVDGICVKKILLLLIDQPVSV